MKSLLPTAVLFLGMGSLIGTMTGCSHAALDQKIDSEVAQETSVKTHGDLASEGSNDLDNATGLSTDQKQKLTDLKNNILSEVETLHEQSLKLRAVLIKDLVAKNYDEDEVELIKFRIKHNEDKRLALIFDAVEKAKNILGHQLTANKHVVEEFMEGGHGGREQ